MPRGTFLIWNALAAIVSTCIAALGAYGIGVAVIGKLSARVGTVALAIETDGLREPRRGAPEPMLNATRRVRRAHTAPRRPVGPAVETTGRFASCLSSLAASRIVR